MSTWVDCFIGPADGRSLDADDLSDLIRTLTEQGLVAGPWGVLTGELEPMSHWGLFDANDKPGPNGETVRSVILGEDIAEMPEPLLSKDPETEALAICFSEIGTANDEMAEFMADQNYRDGRLILFAFPEPQKILFDEDWEKKREGSDGEDMDEDQDVDEFAAPPEEPEPEGRSYTHYVLISGKGTIEDPEGSPLGDLLESYLGELEIGCAYS